MNPQDERALDIVRQLYKLAEDQPYRRGASYVPSYAVFEPLYPATQKQQFVPDPIMNRKRTWCQGSELN